MRYRTGRARYTLCAYGVSHREGCPQVLRIGHDADEEAENRERRLLIEVLFCSLCDEIPHMPMYTVRIVPGG